MELALVMFSHWTTHAVVIDDAMADAVAVVVAVDVVVVGVVGVVVEDWTGNTVVGFWAETQLRSMIRSKWLVPGSVVVLLEEPR